jgi:hypothetical protein
MPKDEFDFEDPLELNGMALLTEEDTTDAMCECFIEEFMRMGYNARQVLALFRNPHYLGMNMVLEKRGEQFVRDYITDVYTRWGRPLEKSVIRNPKSEARQDLPASAAISESDASAAAPWAPGSQSSTYDPASPPNVLTPQPLQP